MSRSWSRNHVRRLSLAGLVCLAVAGWLTATATAGTIHWSSLHQVERAVPASPLGAVMSITCPASSLCLATDNAGRLLVSADPARSRSWQLVKTSGDIWIGTPSCAGGSLCAVTDGSGDVLVSADPGMAASWRLEHVGIGSRDTVLEVACPSSSECVAVDASGNLLVSTDPAGGASTWRHWSPSHAASIERLTCASNTLCLADGRLRSSDRMVVSSIDPMATGSSWSLGTGLPNNSGLLTLLSCPAASLCFASQWIHRELLVSTDPAAGVWRVVHRGAYPVACPSKTYCIGTRRGSFYAIRNPANAGSRWRFQSRRAYLYGSLTCSAQAVCVGFDATNRVFGSADPTGGPKHWSSAVALLPSQCPTTGPGPCPFSAPVVACASRSLCVMGLRTGDLMVTRTPTRGRTWRTALGHAQTVISSLACTASGRLCAGTDGAGRVLLSGRNPARGRAWRISRSGLGAQGVACAPIAFCLVWRWHPYELSSQLGQVGSRTHTFERAQGSIGLIAGMACPSVHLCVASIDGDPAIAVPARVLFSRNPGAARPRWDTAAIGGSGGPIACPSTQLCLLAGAHGQILSSTDPGRAGTWQRHRLRLSGHPLVSLSCAGTHLCAGDDQYGNLYVSRTPAAGAWKHIGLAGLAAPTTGAMARPFACAPGPTCLAVDYRGRLFSSTRPLSAASWSAPRPLSDIDVTAVACTGRSLCVAGTAAGGLVFGRRRA